MTSPSCSLAVAGLPASGKTTYLGRLWIAVDEGKGRLRAPRLPGRLGPLQRLSDPLLEGRYPDRTAIGTAGRFRAPLVWEGREGPRPVELDIADHPGEELVDIFRRGAGSWSEGWQRRASEAAGVLLFVRTDRFQPAVSDRVSLPGPEGRERALWDDLRGRAAPIERRPIPAEVLDAERLLGPEMIPEGKGLESHRSPPLDTAAHPPTTVALVELLQLVKAARDLPLGRPSDRDVRLAVVLSCWDAVPVEWQQRGPDAVQRELLPMLDDFLACNWAHGRARVFGLSSTGFDLRDQLGRSKYLEGEAKTMGSVCFRPPSGGQLVPSPDITLPVGWLIEGDEALGVRPSDG